MTNREWLESLSDEDFADTISETCEKVCTYYNKHSLEACTRYNCMTGIAEWLRAEHKEPKKEFTQDQLNKVFKDKFMERRAIGILEIEELIGELFR